MTARIMVRVRLTLWSVFYLVMVAFIWVLQEWDPEDRALTAALTYSPHYFLLVPLFLLMYGAFRRKNWAALDVQVLALGGVLVGLMGFTVPRPQNCTGPSFELLTYSTQQGRVSPFVLQEIVNVHDPEVVLLQDTGGSGSNYVNALKRSGWQVHSGAGLVTASRHPILRQQALPDVPALVTDLRIASKRIRVINVLLPQVIQPLTLERDARRHQQAVVRIVASAGQQNTVIAGNFNAVPHGRWVHPLRKSFTEAMGLGFGYTYPTFLAVERKDQVWYNTGLCHDQHEVLAERGSDHKAVQVRLRVN